MVPPRRVAALYDIHGNLPALDAVLEAVDREDVDAIVVGGDVVPGPMPSGCLTRLADLDVPVHYVRGNGETDTLRAYRGEPMSRVPERFHVVMRWVSAAVSPKEVERMDAWPLTLELALPGLGRVLFCHATPRDDNELFTRVTPDARLTPLLRATGADTVICGHTHMQFDRMVDGVRVVNAGSVGMPFGEPGADWAILGPDVELRHTDYDLSAAASHMAATDYPGMGTFDIERPPQADTMLELFEASALESDESDP